MGCYSQENFNTIFPYVFPQIQLGEKRGTPLRLPLPSAATAEASFRTSHPHLFVWIFLLQLPANSLPGTALVCCLLPRNSPNLTVFALQTGDKKCPGAALRNARGGSELSWGWDQLWGSCRREAPSNAKEEVRAHEDHKGCFTSCQGQSVAFLL